MTVERVRYGLEVRQKTGEWQTASAGRTREYADDVFRQYAARGECCRIVDSLGTTISEHIAAPPEPPPAAPPEPASAAPAVRERQRIDLSGKGIRCPFESVRHTTVWIAGGMEFERISKEFEKKHGEPVRLRDVT